MENTTSYNANGSGFPSYDSAGYFMSTANQIASGFCSTEKSIGDAECDILRKIGDAECSITKNDNDNAHRTTIHLNSIERDLQNRIHESRQILTSVIGDKTDRVLDRVDAHNTDIKNQLRNFEISNAEKFCDIKTEGFKNTQLILETLAKNKYDAIKDELDETRSEKYNDKYAYQFALQNQSIDYLKQSINSIEQNQRFSNKTVQFGTGNKSGVDQIANQG